jgi:hypothetical protein
VIAARSAGHGGGVGSLRARITAAALAGLALSGCTVGVGAGVAVVVGGAGFLAFDCSDNVIVSVRDPSGAERCGVPISASQGDRQRSLRSCEQSPLGQGSWRLTAPPGSGYVLDERITLPRRDGCERVVYSVELAASSPVPRLTNKP